MVSSAERRLAAKTKLAALETNWRDEEIAEAAKKEATATRKHSWPAPEIAAKAAREAGSTVTESSTVIKVDAAIAEPPRKKAKKIKKSSLSSQQDTVDIKDSEEHVAETSTKTKKKLKKRKASSQPVLIVEGKRKHRAPVELVPTVVPGDLGAVAYREAHNIVCSSIDCPPPLETFDAAEPLLGAHFIQLLRDRGFLAPSPIQAQAWPLALAGKDIIGIAQTGSGKTLAYLLPVLTRLRERAKPSIREPCDEPATPTALILAPTRELIQQIASDAAKLVISIGHRFVPCFGGVWKGDQLKQLGKGCDLLLSTPGRLKDFLEGDKAKGHPPAVDLSNVSYLVLDEADAMLAMGFMPQVRDIANRCLPMGDPEQGGCATGPRAGTARQTLFFTATWPLKVKAAAEEFTQSSHVQLRIGQGVGKDKLTANSNVRQMVQVVEYWDKITRLINVLTSELNYGDTCLVFCGTKGRTEYIVDMLRKSSVVDWCQGIHSGKEQWDRDASLQRFRRHTANGDKRAVLVATDVAARGIDIPGVALVVVYDLNGWNGELNIDSYVHRIGRTGRAGAIGRAFTFIESKDRGIPDLVKLLKDAGQKIPQSLQEVEAEEVAPLQSERKHKGEKAEDDDDDDDGPGDQDVDVELDEHVQGEKARRRAAKGKGKGKAKGEAKGDGKDKAKGQSKGSKDGSKDKGSKDGSREKGKGKGKSKGKKSGKEKGGRRSNEDAEMQDEGADVSAIW